MYETEETVYALLLDARKRPIRCAVISRGTVDAAEVNARRLAELALQYRASAVILAHNHRSGVALPSVEDETSTARLARALDLLGVELSPGAKEKLQAFDGLRRFCSAVHFSLHIARDGSLWKPDNGSRKQTKCRLRD